MLYPSQPPVGDNKTFNKTMFLSWTALAVIATLGYIFSPDYWFVYAICFCVSGSMVIYNGVKISDG